MAIDKSTLIYSAVLFLVSGIGNIDAQSCGGTYTTNYGIFMSPNYPNVYDFNSECTYTISLPTVSTITLIFEIFELDRSDGDFTSITCASNSSFGERTHVWTSIIQPISIPWCRTAQLHFHSDSYKNFTTRGFRVQYQVSTKDCGKTVYGSSSNFSSPNYPENYNNNENCTYTIGSQESNTMTVNFRTFNLESDCQRDWVQVRCDNTGYISPKYCGSTIPKPIYITNCNILLIWFHTDNSNVFSGFSLHGIYTPDECDKINYGGLSSGVITSPNYPLGYVGYACTIHIYPVSSVALVFQSFDLEPFIGNDRVRIDCMSDPGEVVHYFRGNTIPPLISYTLCSRVYIQFQTDWALSGAGFSLRYQVNALVAHSAITTAPKNFTVDVGSRVQLNCTSDAIGYYPSWTMSRDGTDENAAVIASFCDVWDTSYQNFSQYSVVKDGPGVCNLVIKSATLADAGIYKCIDVGLASISSVVTVVAATSTSTGQVAHTAITTIPKNFTVNVGTRVQLDCTSDAKDYLPSWTLSTDGKDENTATVASFCSLDPYFPGEYVTETDGPGVCNLVILSATQAEAGIYTCIDVGLSSIVSVVTVVDTKESMKAAP